jgi:hypothetical protein
MSSHHQPVAEPTDPRAQVGFCILRETLVEAHAALGAVVEWAELLEASAPEQFAGLGSDAESTMDLLDILRARVGLADDDAADTDSDSAEG